MIPTPKTIAAITHVIREMPRTALDWTRDLLTDEQYQRIKDEVAYTVGSMDEADVRRVVDTLERKEAA